MKDRELLELAAKAAGLTITGWTKQGGEEVAVLSTGGYWQPLLKNGITDCDGDSLRLANCLHCRIETPKYKGFGATCSTQTVFRDDPGEQLRRAIVMYAAEIGKAMP